MTGGQAGLLYQNVLYPIAATPNQAGSRMGDACSTSILGWVTTGDASIETARRNGEITLITSVDAHDSSVLGVYSRHCVIVRGR